MSAARGEGLPIIVSGDGCYLTDIEGKRYLDGLAGLFAVQIGYSLRRRDRRGRARADAGAPLLHELELRAPARRSSSPRRSPSSRRATSTACSSSPAAPRPSSPPGSSRASGTRANGERRWKAVSRNVAYHGTTMGALSINGIGSLRTPFEPLVPEVGHVPQHQPLPPARGGDRGAVHRLPARRPRSTRSRRWTRPRSRW